MALLCQKKTPSKGLEKKERMMSWARFEEHEAQMGEESHQIYKILKIQRDESANDLRATQQKSEKLARSICMSMGFGTIERMQVQALSKISPFTLWEPMEIANILMEKIDKLEVWANPQYEDERLLIATVIRRHILVHILRKRANGIFSDGFIEDMQTKLYSVLNWLNSKRDYSEQSTSLEVSAIIFLVKNSADVLLWWDEFSYCHKDIIYARLSITIHTMDY